MALIKKRNIASYIAYCLGIIFFYLESVKGIFFKIFPKPGRFWQYDDHLSLLTDMLCITLIVLLIMLCIRKFPNKHFIFIILPYFLSIISWYYINILPDPDLGKKLGTTTGVWGALFITQYIMHGVWLIPLIAYPADFSFRKLIKQCNEN
ncbi:MULTISPECIES: hypothetical protein [Providencia]|jgi:hypothetical protein|uniref:hypothetical protein n=1 Tax=Providencia TaxID=586 RepID=UPI000D345F46|nr:MULTISPECIES: hypothetical protein [Providencia]MBG5883676.1 hypothetical protein [Providencia alcalifaciens]MBS0925915.1 hypothetical protein [Providencia sp. JGM181]MBS0933900.1 hypothetical protein [Providencia sp. JGM172]MBS0998533.1 hypothetical protein [Providencia sp. JGM178]